MIDIFIHYGFLLRYYLIMAFNEMKENYDMGAKKYKYLEYLIEIGEDLVKELKKNE